LRVPKSCNYYYNKDSPLTGIDVLFRILAILLRQHHGHQKKDKQRSDMFSLICFFLCALFHLCTCFGWKL